MSHLLQVSTSRQTVGLWMAWVVVAFILIQALRAFLNPAGFAEYFGLPLGSKGDEGFVNVYGVRALFLGVCAAALIVRGQVDALSTFAFAAAVMPVGDLLLTASAGAPALTLTRHAVIAVVLVATGWLLRAGR